MIIDSMSQSRFKAIIVGGSIAGLTQAHTLSQAGLEYVLLEARDTISPQLGASIIIMPNGARILDQMGLFEPMSSFMTPMRKSYLRRDDGKEISCTERPKLVEERLGYQCGICERRVFLQSMYDQLEDKSNIQLGKKVLSIEHRQEGVRVACEDGSIYDGDVVIGADGIHSRTRKEMQKYAEESGSPGLMKRDKTSITAQYTCIFGIASPLSSLKPGDTHVSVSIDHSTLLLVGEHGLPQWFFLSALPRQYVGEANIPRFTDADVLFQAMEFKDFHVTEEVTIGDLMEKTTNTGAFALEEANHEVWTYKRVVCVGDAIHKMTPNLGQGGNQAIESAAVLTNVLLDMVHHTNDKRVKLEQLEVTLKQYQSLRQKRAKIFVDISGMATRNESLQTLKPILRLLYMEPKSGEVLADMQTEMYHTAPYLDFLPLPKRTLGNKIWERGVERVKKHDNVPRPRILRELSTG